MPRPPLLDTALATAMPDEQSVADPFPTAPSLQPLRIQTQTSSLWGRQPCNYMGREETEETEEDKVARQ